MEGGDRGASLYKKPSDMKEHRVGVGEWKVKGGEPLSHALILIIMLWKLDNRGQKKL